MRHLTFLQIIYVLNNKMYQFKFCLIKDNSTNKRLFAMNCTFTWGLVWQHYDRILPDKINITHLAELPEKRQVFFIFVSQQAMKCVCVSCHGVHTCTATTRVKRQYFTVWCLQYFLFIHLFFANNEQCPTIINIFTA